MGFSCPKCSNSNKEYFYNINGKLYCRKCITFVGTIANSDYIVKSGDYHLNYCLTTEQQKASDFILDNVIKNTNCALNAVCGAGKTEIIYDVLQYCLHKKLKIGIAIPRKDVVIELQERIDRDFNVNVVSVYGEHHEIVEGDIIIFTTHQAFRYNDYFDVLIVDEVDAFPYNNNLVLKNIVSKCSKVFVYLSATMPRYIEKDNKINKFYLNKRYHGFDLPIPKYKETFNMLSTLKRYLRKYDNKVVLVYFPTIKLQKLISQKVKYDYLINSKIDNREEVLKQIKVLDKGVVFTTTVLERGITIKNVTVIVFNADNRLFNEDTLIQISGRVGRHKDYYKGDIIFVCKRVTKEIKRTIKILKKCNE